MSMSCRFATFGAAVLALAAGGCASTTYQAKGSYVAVVVGGGLTCQSRQEFYFTGGGAGRGNAVRTYLGTCSPLRIIKDFDGPGANNRCFAISEDGTSMVYLHLPSCGAGSKAAAKPGGVYLHSVAGGDRLLYRDAEVRQVVMGGLNIAQADEILVDYTGRAPSTSGAVCGQLLIISATGKERPWGQPDNLLCGPR